MEVRLIAVAQAVQQVVLQVVPRREVLEIVEWQRELLLQEVQR